MIGTRIECTLWQLDYTAGQIQGRVLFVTADPSGADATLEAARRAAIRPIPEDARVLAICRIADTIRGTGLRVGDETAWPELREAGKAEPAEVST